MMLHKKATKTILSAFLIMLLFSIVGTPLPTHAQTECTNVDQTVSFNEALSGTAQRNTVNEIASTFCKPVPRITIPGLSFTDPTKNPRAFARERADGELELIVPFLAEYLSAIYKYSIGIISVLAVIMIIIGGIQLMIPSGDGDNVNEAKKRIIGALVGLFLAVGSYVILTTINPLLVGLGSLNVEFAGDARITTNSSDNHAPAKITANCDGLPGLTAVPKDLTELLPIRQSDGKADCGQFAFCKKGIAACWTACLAQLEPWQRSTIPDKYFKNGVSQKMDCNTTSNLTQSKASKGRSISVIGIHEGPGTNGTVYWWWLKKIKGNMSGGISSHYFINRDGKIIQVMNENWVATHGVHNANSIGIDLAPSCPKTKDTASLKAWQRCNYTSAQYNSLRNLIAEIKSRHPINTIKGHCEVGSGGNDHVDPRNFDWRRIGESNESHNSHGVCLGFHQVSETMYTEDDVCCHISSEGLEQNMPSAQACRDVGGTTAGSAPC